MLRLLKADFDTKKSDISDIKNSSLINLSSDEFENDWHVAVEYIDKAMKRIMSTSDDGFGAYTTKWIPYKAMIPVLAAFLYHIDELEFTKRAFANEVLKKWYWASVFSERYSGSPENTSLEDLKELINSVKNMRIPEFVSRAVTYIKELDLRKIYSSSSAIYKGVINLVVLNGAKDFLYGDNIAFHKLEDHHIFPQNYLRRKVGLKDKEKINTILNRTLISRETNNHIKDKSPSKYLKEIEKSGNLQSILEPHFISQECIEHMRNNNYNGFLKCRDKAIKNRVLQLLE